MKNKRKILLISFILLAIVLVLYLLPMHCLKKNSYSYQFGHRYIYFNSYEKIVVVYPSYEDENTLSEADVTAVSLSDDDADEVLFVETDGVYCAVLTEGTYNIIATCSGFQTETRMLTIDADNNLYIIRLLMESENRDEGE